MKKVLTTALVLGALYGTANAAPITSPIYMPQAGKAVTDLSIGYTSSELDKVPTGVDESMEKSWNIVAKGMYGATDRVSVNYGFDLDFSREIGGLDESAKFTNFYIGVTGRVVDIDAHKLDILFNIGQETTDLLLVKADQVYADLAVRYGLDLDMYNLGFSFGGRFYNDAEAEEQDPYTLIKEKEKLERDFVFYFKLENEFIISEQFTVGLDLFYNMNGDITYKENPVNKIKTKSYDEYGFNIDANFGLNENAFVGAYFTMAFNDMELWENKNYKDQNTYKFGLKFTSQF